jgi:hypothetical protein
LAVPSPDRSIANVRFSSAIGGRGHPGVSDKVSANANLLHQERRVDALILLNDMTSFPREEEQLVHTGASMEVRQWVGR